MIFNIDIGEGKLFDLKTISIIRDWQQSDAIMAVKSDGGLDLLEHADIVIVPGWHYIATALSPELMNVVYHAYRRDALVVSLLWHLCTGLYGDSGRKASFNPLDG